MNAADVLRSLYGASFEAPDGVLHVAAVWSGPAPAPAESAAEQLGVSRVIRIDDHAPRSSTDRFVLGAARARADAIITSGRILREETTLTHEFGADAESDAALHAWRSETLGKPRPPRSVVLTSGMAIRWDHPLLDASCAPLVVSSEEGCARIAASANAAGVEVRALARPGLRAVVELLRDDGLPAITVEAGPTTTAALYEAPIDVDELWLSRFVGDLALRSRGPEFIAESRLEALLERQEEGRAAKGIEENEEARDSLWRFERWCRRRE